ncbi:MAG: Trk system potassium transporter TrkA [Alphaproteobacteria bacterium]|nr:MAG: Trk system potassium transporter TrkA [Alphaproteobacteria bacterium]
MRVVICGAGQVGFHVAEHLAEIGHDVTVIDRSPRLIRRISDLLDVRAIEGHASDPDVLDQAQAREADLLIAVTALDEVNMVACQVAHTLFDVPEMIARVRNPAYLDGRWRRLFGGEHGLPFGPDRVIAPEREVSRAIYARLEVPGAFESVRLVDDRVRVLGLHLDDSCPVLDTPLRQLTELFPDLAVRVLAVERDNRIWVPTSDDQLLAGDDIYIAVAADQVARAMGAFGHEERAARNLVIVGGGEVGVGLARIIEQEDRHTQIKLIERDEERAAHAADQVTRTVVLNGDALEPDILHEAGIEDAETIITVTNSDQVNILSALLGKHFGCQRSIALINKATFAPLVHGIGVDVRVDPRATTVSSILRHIRRGGIRDVRTVADGKGELLEARLLDRSRIVHKTIREADFPLGVVVGALVRDDEIIIPRPDTVLEAGDRLVIFAERDAVKEVEHLLMLDVGYY